MKKPKEPGFFERIFYPCAMAIYQQELNAYKTYLSWKDVTQKQQDE